MTYFRFLLLPLLIACAQMDKAKETTQMEYNTTVGENLNAHRYADIYFSGQPSDEDLKNLKNQGFTHVINLRSPSEKAYDEKAEAKTVKKNNMNYSLVTMDLSQPLTDEYIESVTAKVVAHRSEGKTLIHCSSGQRVALWTGGHFYKDHGYSEEQVLEMTEKMGLEKPMLKVKLENYLGQYSKE